MSTYHDPLELAVRAVGELYEDCNLKHTPPTVSKPLTDEQIAEIMMRIWGCASIAPRHAQVFARAIEAAHGIK